MKILFTDLDGTLLNSKNTISKKDLQALELLKKKKTIIVIATGRSIYSAKKVLNQNLPIDYLMFSTGLGIMNWKTSKIIYKNSINKNTAKQIIDVLIQQKKDFAAHHQIPNNHFYYYYTANNINDVSVRNKLYENYITPLKSDSNIGKIAQFIVILSSNYSEFIELQTKISTKISGIRIIRATSPLNNSNIWFEIYPKNVSKGLTALWLCKQLNINRNETIGIGNDYNDIDLLKFTKKSFIVENAADNLKKLFEITTSNENSGVANVIKTIKN